MRYRIDLCPLLAHPAAMAMLLLARGQLNQAFRTHGLHSPDPLRVRNRPRTDAAELDAPAARGIEHARARFGEAFDIWAEEMPRQLAQPVLDILWRAFQALVQQNGDNEACVALREAHQFLLSQVDETGWSMPARPIGRAGNGPAAPGQCELSCGETQP